MLIVAGLAAEASAAIILQGPTNVASSVGDGVNTSSPSASVASGTVTASLDQGAYSSTSSLSTASDGFASFSGTFNMLRGGAVNSMAEGQVNVRFTPSENMQYALSGSFTNSAGATMLASEIYVAALPFQMPFLNTQFSDSAATFSLGNAAGSINNLSGSLTGTLLAGVAYEWESRAYTEPSSPLPGQTALPDNGATASGSVLLTLAPLGSSQGSPVIIITTTTTTPEPSSLIVWTLLGLSIGVAGWWRSRKLAT
jgi:hypothetical protein